MKQQGKRWILCPRCGETIGVYSESVEKAREEAHFKTYCKSCKRGVTPLYI